MVSPTSAPASRPAPAGRDAGPVRPRDHRPLLVAGAAAAGAGLVALADPTERHVPLCALHATTGLDCPFCGGLRAVQDLVHGDVVAAAGHNLLFVTSLPLLAFAWVRWWHDRRRGDTGRLDLPAWTGPAALALLLVFGIARNLPALAWLDSR